MSFPAGELKALTHAQRRTIREMQPGRVILETASGTWRIYGHRVTSRTIGKLIRLGLIRFDPPGRLFTLTPAGKVTSA